jgi:hypothetical protein
MSTIAEALESARTKRGLPKTAAAKELGCSEMTYAMWARGVWKPSADRPGVVDHLATFTGFSRFDVLCLLGVLSAAEAKRCKGGRVR